MRNDGKLTRILLFVCLLVFCLPAHAQTDKREAESTTSQSLEFGARGTIQIVDSHGSVKIEGWDKEEVELTVLKKTQKKYESKDLSKAEKELEKVKVAMEIIEENAMLVIYTKYQSWTPFRMFGGKANLNLNYIIKVPRQSTLFIKHGIGELSVTNVSGDIQATASIGEISLRLPEENSYAVNARARIGDVSSEFGPITQRQGPFSVGAKLEGEPGATTRRVYLRVGIGDIQVTKLHPPDSGNPDEKGVTNNH
jgi:Putative adhesin